MQALKLGFSAGFDTLKHCIVGRGHDPKNVEQSLQEVMYHTEEDLQSLVKILESKVRGAVVLQYQSCKV